MKNEETIFAEALGIPDAEARSAYLDHACEGDAPLREQVEALLKADERAAEFMRSPAAALGVTAAAADPAGSLPEDHARTSEPIGATVGPYKLLERIGEGGMGVVYMADQLRPVRRRVALKIIKPGMDTKQVIARFEAERQALAMMDHPSIARVLDAGTTDAGRPYFAMELVKGVPITEYCDKNNLTPRERLGLFVQVCQAVQHAHTKGVIHRDLKPTNILVTLHDGVPVPKVIDFGIAKATGGAAQQLTDKTLFTHFAQMIGTPLYMSPEQAEFSGLDVDTRSDVYSLGVLLYELLTGTTPFDKERLGEAALDEVRRIIREEEPPRPSTRLSTLLGEKLTVISAHRKTDPGKLGQSLRGELDWIVMKSLEKDRTRRYETANGLARDVERYLADETVQACPPSRLYRFRKFARRNKPLILTSALVAASLMLGTVISTWQTFRAVSQKLEADRQRNDATAARDLARVNFALAREATDRMLTRAAGELAEIPHAEKVRRALLEDALQFHQQFLEQQSDDPQVRKDAADAYLRVARISGLLGRPGDGLEACVAAISTLELTKHASAAPVYEATLADAHQTRGKLLVDLDRLPEARGAYVAALTLREQLVANQPNDAAQPLKLIELLKTMSDLHQNDNQPDADRFLLRVRSICRHLAAEHPEWPGHLAELAGTCNNLGVIQSRLGRHPEAAEAFKEAVTVQERRIKQGVPTEHDRALLSLYLDNLAIYQATGKAPRPLAEWIRLEQTRVVELERRSSDFPAFPDHKNDLTGQTLHVSRLLAGDARLHEAEAAIRRAVAVQEALVKDFPDTARYRRRLAEITHTHARLLKESWRAAEAEEAFRRCLDLLGNANAVEKEHPNHKRMLAGVKLALQELNGRRQVSELVALCKASPAGVADAIGRVRTVDVEKAPLKVFELVIVGELLTLGGDAERGAAALRRATRALVPSTRPRDLGYHLYYKALGWTLLKSGKAGEAHAAFRIALGTRNLADPAFTEASDGDHWTAAYFLDSVTQQQFVEYFSRRRQPTAAIAWFYIGQRMEMEQRHEDALAAYRQGVAAGGQHLTVNWSAYRLNVLTAQASTAPVTRPAASTRPAHEVGPPAGGSR